jgi:LCP family protein required for cell wall assembly
MNTPTPEDSAFAHRAHAHRRRVSTKVRRRRTIVAFSLAVVLLFGGAATAILVMYNQVDSGINRSSFTLPTAAVQTPKPRDETNILVMGLDSRVDQNGDALPDEVYQYLRAGDETNGGYNANVLMFVHIPAGDGDAVGISIPRDDYVELPGAPSGVSHAKIKEAYGLAFSERYSDLVDQDELSRADAYQQARAAGRQAQIETVSAFLGDVRIDHFIEMTMGGFFSIAQAVAPITVCLNHDTEDIYSGAYFSAGINQLDASEAMSFVRQRRDLGAGDLELTDFDRTRRQQAFMVSLANRLKEQDTLTDLNKLNSLISVAKQHMALDEDLDLLGFATVAAELARGKISFVTLPITQFAEVDGKSVNLVDLEQIHTVVAELLGQAPPTDPAPEQEPLASDSADAESGADEADTAVGATEPAPPATETVDPAGTTVYNSWEEPLRSGNLVCVN